MSLNSALNTALNGLNVNSRLADVVSLNVANAATEGYGVRRASVASASYSGVQVTSIERHQNSALIQTRREAGAMQNYDDLKSQTLTKIEAAFGAVGDVSSIAAHINRFDAALIEASSDPFSEQTLAQVSSRLTSLVSRIHQASDTLQTERESADAQISTLVSQLSSDLAALEKLDRNLVSTKEQDPARGALLDQKQVLIDRISSVVPVRESINSQGATTLQTDKGFVLYSQNAPRLEFSATPVILADMTLDSGALGAVVLDGTALENGFGKLGGGLLQAAFEARDVHTVSAQSKLDRFAFDLALQVSTNDGSILSGETGMLTNRGGALDVQDITGFSSLVTVNPDATQLNKFRTGFGSGLTRQDGQQLADWSAGLSQRSNLSASGMMSDLIRVASMLSEGAAQDRVLQDEQLTFSTAFAEAMKAEELEEGVDTDSELQSLLRIEKAYAANARMIQTIDAMMQTLLEI